MRAKSSIVAHMWRTEADPRNFDLQLAVSQVLLTQIADLRVYRV